MPLATPLGDDMPLGWRLGAIYGIIALAATCSQFFSPSRLALIGDIVEVSQQARASSRTFMTLSLGIVVGPAHAAPLYFHFGPAWALIFDAFSFLVSFAPIRAMHLSPTSASPSARVAPNVVSEFCAGLRCYASSRVLRTLLLVTFMTLFGSSAINALGIFFLTQNLHASAQLFGILSAGTGIGVLAGSLIATWLVPKLGITRAFWLSTMLACVLIMGSALQTNFIAAFVVLGHRFGQYDTIYLVGGTLLALSSVYAWSQLRHGVTANVVGTE